MAQTGTLFKTGGHGIHVSLDMFFDRQGVITRMDAKTNKVLSSAGAFSRTVMQRGMRKRKKISSPGEYPSAHQNPLLREKVRFGFTGNFHDALKGVVIGPALLDSPDKEVAASGKTVPELINEGGVVMRRMVYDRNKKELRRTRQPIRWKYRARPFVDLTMPKAAAKLAENMEKFDFR
jgi:hypothetical protein